MLRTQSFYRHVNRWISKRVSACVLSCVSLQPHELYFGHMMRRADSLEKTLMLGKIEGRKEEKGMTEDEMVGWHHRLNGHVFE